MVEELIRLLWVEQDPSVRAERWFSFSRGRERNTAARQSSCGSGTAEDKGRALTTKSHVQAHLKTETAVEIKGVGKRTLSTRAIATGRRRASSN
jgi:hypothetical protein